MPIYLFQHKKTKKIAEVFLGMNDEKVYNGPKGNQEGQWERVFTSPNAQVKENWDINNPKDFVHKTRHSKGNMGDILDRSEELSRKRAERSDEGRDPVKDKMFDKWSKKRGGKKHPEDDRPTKK